MKKNDRLKILRILSGLTQDDLAAAACVPRSSIGVWESTKYGPSHTAVPKLADVLNVTPGFLAFGYPAISSAIWVPHLPERPDHIVSQTKTIKTLLPLFLGEISISSIATTSLSDEEILCFLGNGKAFQYLIVADSKIAGVIDTLEYGANTLSLGNISCNGHLHGLGKVETLLKKRGFEVFPFSEELQKCLDKMRAGDPISEVRTASEMLNEIRRIKGLVSDAALVNVLGVRQPTVSSWRSRDSLPYKEIINFCIKEGISTDSIFLKLK